VRSTKPPNPSKKFEEEEGEEGLEGEEEEPTPLPILALFLALCADVWMRMGDIVFLSASLQRNVGKP
jgi:hypothetical protein